MEEYFSLLLMGSLSVDFASLGSLLLELGRIDVLSLRTAVRSAIANTTVAFVDDKHCRRSFASFLLRRFA